MKFLPVIVVFITTCCCESVYNDFLNELRLKNPGNTAGLVPYYDKSMKHLTQWLTSMKKYKLSPNCGTTAKRKKSFAKNNDKKSLMKILNCAGDETKTIEIQKFLVTSYEKSQDQSEVMTLKLLKDDHHTEGEHQIICAKIENIFGSQIEEITSNFFNDRPTGKSEIRSKDFIVDLILDVYGIPHGMFRIRNTIDNGKTKLGRFKHGKISGSCWTLSQEKVLMAPCDMDDGTTIKPNKKVWVFFNNFQRLIIGMLSETSPDILQDANEAMITSTTNDKSGCYLELNATTISKGLTFQFNISSLLKVYSQNQNPFSELCKSQEACSQSKPPNQLIKDFLINLDEQSHYLPEVDESKVAPENASYLISEIENIFGEKNFYVAKFCFHECFFIKFRYFGGYTDKLETNFHGEAVLKVALNQNCPQKICSSTWNHDIYEIWARFDNGSIQCPATIISNKMLQTTVVPLVNGIVHGLVITKGLGPIYPFYYDQEGVRITEGKGIGFAGKFLNGRKTGTILIGLIGEPIIGQGLLYGQVDEHGHLTGQDIAYIYPDYQMALHGEFRENVMKKAKLASIYQVTCLDNFIQLSFKAGGEKACKEISDENIPKGFNDVNFYYDPSSSHSYGNLTDILEPFELSRVRLGSSTVDDVRAGNGMFARRNFEIGEVVSLYTGLRTHNVDEFTDECCASMKLVQNSREINPELKICFTYTLKSLFGERLDVPAWGEWGKKKYNVTLGHMVNHAFPPKTNCKFSHMEHPRYGVISTLVSTRTINKDEELFLDYGYNDQESSKEYFPWYFEGKEKKN